MTDMKTEIKDILWQLTTGTAPAAGLSWWSQVHWTAILTGTFLTLQILYLLRKWWREESDWGQKLRRWAKGEFTRPGGL